MEKKSYFSRILTLMFGLIVCAFGLSFIIHSGLGYDSWNVFHHGLTLILPIHLGQASVLVSIVMIVSAIILGEPLGLGTVLNGLTVGNTVQFIIDSQILKVQDTLISGLSYLFIGMIILGIGSYFYMKPGLGSGPRDSFTVALAKKTGIDMGYMKSIIEIIAVIVGILLKGSFGIGTVIVAIFSGIILQIIFNILKFDPKKVEHENIKETFENILKK